MSYTTKYKTKDVVNFWTFWLTTTITSIWDKINVEWYSYMRIFIYAPFTKLDALCNLYCECSWIIWGTLYWTLLTPTTIASDEVFLIVQDNTITTWSWIYPWRICNAIRNKASWTDYVLQASVILNIAWLSELQLYANHNDTGTINTTIDYILFNL